MKEISKEELLQALPRILEEQKITPLENLHFSRWQIQPWHKILIPGNQIFNGKPRSVRLKVRVPGNFNPRDSFIRNEKVAQIINDQLFRAGLPAQRTLAVNFDQPPEWILRQEIEGRPLGHHSFLPAAKSSDLAAFIKSLRQSLDEIGRNIDRNLLSNYNWQDKWLGELKQRHQAVIDHLGRETTELIEAQLSQQFDFQLTNSLVHADLSPSNILQGRNGFCVIDWGEALWAPRAIDWLTVWSFAFARPDLQQQLVKMMMSESANEDQRHETKLAAKMTAARLMYKFAEFYDYYLRYPNEKQKDIDEAFEALPLAKANFTKLLRELQ